MRHAPRSMRGERFGKSRGNVFEHFRDTIDGPIDFCLLDNERRRHANGIPLGILGQYSGTQ